MAKEAIQKEIADLRRQQILKFSGKTEKVISSSVFKLKDTSIICIRLQKETLPLNESFEFSGGAKLTYELTEAIEGVPDSLSDGMNYLIRGKAILTYKDDDIAVTIENNTIEITDQRC